MLWFRQGRSFFHTFRCSTQLSQGRTYHSCYVPGNSRGCAHRHRGVEVVKWFATSSAVCTFAYTCLVQRKFSHFVSCNAVKLDPNVTTGPCDDTAVELSSVHHGSNPVVVFIHGLDSFKGTFRASAEELRRRGIESIALDLRGHGHSTMGSPEDFGPAQLAADVRYTLTKAGVLGGPAASRRKLVLVGHSMGGRVALRYAANYPTDFAAVIIEDMDCTFREYATEYMNPSQDDEEKRRKFNRAFSSWEECRSALLSFGYEPGRVDGWRKENPPRVASSGTEGCVWSSINPFAQWLARRTVLASDDSYHALCHLAGLHTSGCEFPSMHVLVAGDEGTVCSWDKMPGGIRDMQSICPWLSVTKFPKANHSIHNSGMVDFVDHVHGVVSETKKAIG
eukprot:TRINITY_DN47240_c0_g1_i1.p1 TRINITY_DN47240_c0_g1~~TRINITY_DN47240_c0_g1_i1.p1  ORF type:complete len:393 (-),score=25.41 TRINITY_DN47240_c0_g1_i1:50-1228(-)